MLTLQNKKHIDYLKKIHDLCLENGFDQQISQSTLYRQRDDANQLGWRLLETNLRDERYRKGMLSEREGLILTQYHNYLVFMESKGMTLPSVEDTKS